jgi:hypothetical protein
VVLNQNQPKVLDRQPLKQLLSNGKIRLQNQVGFNNKEN